MNNLENSVIERMLKDSLDHMLKALKSEVTGNRKLWLTHVTEEDLIAAVEVKNDWNMISKYQYDPMIQTFISKVVRKEDLYPVG